jgi:putative ABC transport system permease protein
MIFILAWRNIWRNKRRSLITAASVSFALFFAIIMRSMQLGTYDNVYDNVIGSSTGYIQIHKQGYWDEPTLENSMVLNTDSLTANTQIDNIKALVPRLESFSLLSNGPKTKGALILGVNPKLEINYFRLEENLVAGSVFAHDASSLILTEGLAEYFDVDVGDTVVMIGSGYRGISANAKYPVAGIVKLNSPELNQRLAYLPLQEAQFLFGTYQRITSVVVVPEVSDEFPELTEELRTELDTALFEVMTWREMLPELIQAMEADSAGGVVILFILYLVIGFGVFGTILMLTAERLPEFGILISIGMSRGKIAAITFLEILFLGILGVLAGWILSLPFTYYYHYNPIRLTGQLDATMQEYGLEPLMPFSIDPAIPLVHGIGVLILTVVLSIYAIFKIYQLNPVEAVRT